ncbi:hypothetical protein FANTH_6292 [Fusarium anthophilum]|uniref:Uncharacterized protein n=1 Tax=Fusarium anthophilum TaxID=48485 RepID=A0A8H5E544_9HYPO|nr:hypothetical protein FANTH_6292 [Fusarium anthophilum]
MKFTYYTFLPIVLLATSTHAGYCGLRAKVYKVGTHPHWHELFLECAEGYGDLVCPYGTTAQDIHRHEPVDEYDLCSTTELSAARRLLLGQVISINAPG